MHAEEYVSRHGQMSDELEQALVEKEQNREMVDNYKHI